jgi:hypothetical protein
MKTKYLFFAALFLLSKDAMNPAHAVTDAECDKAIGIVCSNPVGICSRLTENGLGNLNQICHDTYWVCGNKPGNTEGWGCEQFVCDSFKQNRCAVPKS